MNTKKIQCVVALYVREMNEFKDIGDWLMVKQETFEN